MLLFLSLVILIPILVFALGEFNTAATGWRQRGGGLDNARPIFWNTTNNLSVSASPIGSCVHNSSNQDYFVPTKTLNEWDAFKTKIQSAPSLGLSLSHCEGDMQCLSSDTCSTYPINCGACVFSCGQDLVDSRDSQHYPTVSINGQCWMAKDLNIGTRQDISVAQSNNSVVEKHCPNNFNSGSTACDGSNLYGGLYTYGEATNYANTLYNDICPTGWHLPTTAEMQTMTNYLSNTYPGTAGSGSGTYSYPRPGTVLKVGGTVWGSPQGNNLVNMSAYPAGYGVSGSTIGNFNSYEFLWTFGSSSTAVQITVGQEDVSYSSFSSYPNDAFAIRCIKNPIFIFNYQAGIHGSLIGQATQAVSPGQSGTEVSAVPDYGYIFQDWSDGSFSNPRTDINAASNISVTANFFAAPLCGNGICDTSETSASCPGDCPGCCLTSSVALPAGFTCDPWACTANLGVNDYCFTSCVDVSGNYAGGWYKNSSNNLFGVISSNCRAIANQNSCDHLIDCTWLAALPKCNLWCGDGICSSSIGENCTTCKTDCGGDAVCGVSATCGNGVCDNGETCSTCPGDCGTCSSYCTAQTPGDATTAAYCAGISDQSLCNKSGGVCTWKISAI